MPISLRRRQLLGAVAAVVPAVVAGCWGHGPSLTMRETSDSDLLSSAASTISVDTTSDRLRPIVETIETGTTKLSSPSPRPRVKPAQPVVASAVQRPIKYDGAYYTLSLSKTVERTLIEAEFHIGTAGTPPEDTAKPIEYDALPERDRESLEGALPPETGERDYESVQTFYDEQEVDSSELVSETEYDAVVRDGQRYSLELDHTEEKSGYNYHYTAERVAATDDDFLSWLRSRYRYELTGLSEGEQQIVTEAIEDGRYTGGDGEDAFSSLSERVLSQPALERDDGAGEWFVRYDGSEYVAELTAPPEFH